MLRKDAKISKNHFHVWCTSFTSKKTKVAVVLLFLESSENELNQKKL